MRVLDNLNTGRREDLDGLAIEWHLADVRDFDAVRRAMEGIEHVYHLAAVTSIVETMADPLTCYAVNLIGSLHVLQASQEAGARSVVLASSAAVYGNAGRIVGEDAPAAPLSPYGASKLAMEGAARLYAQAFGLPSVCLRFFNVYGPGQSGASPYAAVIPRFIEKVLAGATPTIDGDGSQTRDFVFVEDAVRGLLLASERAHGGEVFNIGGGGAVSIVELYEVLRRLVPGVPQAGFGPPRPGDIRHSAADIHAAQTSLGFRPQVSLEQGLRMTIEWFRACRAHADG